MIEIENFNSKYDLTEVYSNSKKLGLEYNDPTTNSIHEIDIIDLIDLMIIFIDDININELIKLDKLGKTNMLASNCSSVEINNSAYPTIDSNFNSFCLLCITNKQIRIMIQDKLMKIVDNKLDKVYVNL